MRAVVKQRARVRAARELSGYELSEAGKLIAAELNVSARTAARIVSGERDVGEEDLRRIGDALGVPRWFMDHGLDVEVTPRSVAEKLAAQEEKITRYETRISRLERLVSTLVSERGVPPLPGAGGRPRGGDQPKRPDHLRPDEDSEADDPAAGDG